MNKIKQLYNNRFDPDEVKDKKSIWEILCNHFFNKVVGKDAKVLDLGAGYCEFINNIDCEEKYAVDLNEDLNLFAHPDVKTFNKDCSNLEFLLDNYFDVVFVSNFFEHLPSKQIMDHTLEQIHCKLKPGGKLIVLQPNIKYLYDAYWDFYDHHLPLSHLSMVEALEKVGFSIVMLKPKFLPYTVKSKIPRHKFLVYLYLKLPVVQTLMGKQMLIIAQK